MVLVIDGVTIMIHACSFKLNSLDGDGLVLFYDHSYVYPIAFSQSSPSQIGKWLVESASYKI